MPLYEYRCDRCGPFDSLKRDNRQPCPNCGGEGKRKWSVRTGIVVHEYWNPSLGEMVTTSKDFDRKLRRKADQLSEKRGRTVNLERADPDGPGVTDEGLREQHDARVKRGIAEPTPRIV